MGSSPVMVKVRGLLYVRIKVRRFCSSGDERTDNRVGDQRKDYGGESPEFISEMRKRGHHLTVVHPGKDRGEIEYALLAVAVPSSRLYRCIECVPS